MADPVRSIREAAKILEMDQALLLPTKEQAEEGLLEIGRMTALRTRQAIAAQAIAKGTLASSLAALKAVNPNDTSCVILLDDFRGGVFKWVAGDFSILAGTDPSQGVIVTSTLFPATSGVWVRVNAHRYMVPWFNAKGDNTTDDLSALNNAILARKLMGGVVELVSGEYKLGAGNVTIDFTHLTADAHQDLRQVSFLGHGAGNTALRVTSAQYALAILGGADPTCLIYGPFGGFVISKHDSYAGYSQGMRLRNVAFATFDDILLHGLDVGISQTSCLSNTWNRLRITLGGVGMEIASGYGNTPVPGFSDHNANKYNDAEFRSQSLWAVSGGPSSGIWFNNLTMQGVGTPGNDATGGMNLTFSGAQGGVGLVVNGAYIEYNGGYADFVLNNTGTETIEHHLHGVNFSRISAAKFVKHMISLQGGPQILNLYSCHFDHFNDYVPDANRKYVEFTAGVHKVICHGCHFGSSIERGSLRNEESKEFAGYVGAAGTPNLPSSWAVSKSGVGFYTVTHNLNIQDYEHSVVANIVGVDSGIVRQIYATANSFQVLTGSDIATPADRAFTFQLRII